MQNRDYWIVRAGLRGLAFACTMALPAQVLADEVTLRSADGSVNIVGTFVALENNNYTVRTALGELRIAASRVTCEGAGCPVLDVTEADVEIAGSETVGRGLMPLLLEGFAASVDAEATVSNASDGETLIAELIGDAGFGDTIGTYSVESSGSNDAFRKLLSGETHIGMSSRRIRPDEAQALLASGAGNMVSPGQEYIVAVDSLVVVTHPANPVSELTVDQLGKIYSGAIKNWRDVGGPDQDILVVDRPSRSGTRAVIAETIFDRALEATLAPLVVRIANDNGQVANIVNQNENAIGFLGYAFQRGTKPITLINDCGMTIAPDAFSARTEEYPLQRRMYLYARSDTQDDQVSDFLTFASSSAADSVIAKSGFIGLGIDRRAQTDDSLRATMLRQRNANPTMDGPTREMLATMVNYDRLSTTFRFQTGSSELDERGRVDMARLADYLADQPAGTEVVFVGFADSVGRFDNNLLLSQNRASQALAAFERVAAGRLNGITFKTRGFSEIAPSGCNETEVGRRINRRVEVWINTAG